MHLNFYPIQFNFKEYQITRIPFEEGLLQKLKEQHNSTHSFFLNRGYIYISNKEGEDLQIGEVSTIPIENKEVTSSLLKHLFFRSMREKFPTIKPIGFYPYIIPSNKSIHDLFRKHLPTNLQGKITFNRYINIQIRTVKSGGELIYGFTVSLERNYKLDISCEEINSQGFDLIGRDVVYAEIIPGLEEIMLPDETLIGVVKGIEGDKALIGTNEGDVYIPLEMLFLSKSKRNIKDYLVHILEDFVKAEQILENLNSDKSEFFQLNKKFNEINEVAKSIFLEKDAKSSTLFQNKDGFCFEVKSTKSIKYDAIQLENPIFIFDPSRTKTSYNPDKGLIDYGAYDATMFSPKVPKILFICKNDIRGYASTFLKELTDGIPQSQYFKKGFINKYCLTNIDGTIREVKEYNLEEYKTIISSLSDKPDIVIVSLPMKFKDERDAANSLYYNIKSILLGQGIPVQFVNNENIQNSNEYKLNAIALQMYAKMGGVPYALATKQSFDRELVIGIGHSIIRQNSYKNNDQDRVVGITTFFAADGQYLFSDKVKDVPFQSYFQELLDSLKSSFLKLEKENAWQEGDTIRLVFHIFKPIKELEFEVVKGLVNEFSRYKIKFAFVTISEYHQFLMLDPNQRGIEKKSYGRTVRWGENIPKRGANIILDESSCLIQTLGVDEVKTMKHGSSNPILIRIRIPNRQSEMYDEVEELLYTDINYIANQIYKFTYLSWRGFLPNLKPATMLYSHLIAKSLGNLRRVPGWNPSSVNFNLKYKKWFL